MNKPTVLQIEHLSKVYKLYDKPVDRLIEVFHPLKKRYHRKFYALQDISFSVDKGEVLGIIGKNGSGKSTILQIITGVLTPTQGEVNVSGKISALLELGAGFNPDLTGLENVYFKSSLLGHSKEETDAKLDEILSFADIGEFVNQPVKSYSSGMFVRLAFAVAINVDPDILIIDEALSVGDFRFRQKCMRKFDELLSANKTILFVTHDHGSVVQFCTRAIWLKDGRLHQDGNPGDVCKDYISYMTYGDSNKHDSGERKKNCLNEMNFKNKSASENIKTDDKVHWRNVDSCSSFGDGGAEITRVAFYAKNDRRELDVFEGGERVVFTFEIKAGRDIESPIVGFHLNNAKGINLLGMNSYAAGVSLDRMRADDVNVVEFEFDFPFLKNDTYSFSPAIAEGSQDEHVQHHWVYDACVVKICSDNDLAKIGNQLVIRENFDIRLKKNKL